MVNFQTEGYCYFYDQQVETGTEISEGTLRKLIWIALSNIQVVRYAYGYKLEEYRRTRPIKISLVDATEFVAEPCSSHSPRGSGSLFEVR